MRRIGIGLLLASAAVAACGNDVPTYSYNCCSPQGLYYICQSRESYGRCISSPPDVTGCTLQTGACPEP